MTVTTASGSTYLFSLDMELVCRAEHSHDMRRDNEWLRVLTLGDVVIGQPLRMLLDLLEGDMLTVRTTSPVVAIGTDVLV
jgi:hypothetical protein